MANVFMLERLYKYWRAFMKDKEKPIVTRSNKTFIVAIILIIAFVCIFSYGYFKTKSSMEDVGEEIPSTQDIAADEGTIFSKEDKTLDEVDLSKAEGVYLAGYNDFEIMKDGNYVKLNFLDNEYLKDDNVKKVVDKLALSAIKLDNETAGMYYNIQPAITDLYGGSLDVELKDIKDFFYCSQAEILASEIVMDKSVISIKDGLVNIEKELLPENCQLELKGDGRLVLIIPQYEERITFYKTNVSID